jgi:F-type H+-transporting ATPase subunit a
MFSPLEQFEVRLIQPLSFFGFFDISITVVTLYLLLIFSFSLLLFRGSLFHATIIPNNWQSIVELIYEFVLDIVRQQAGRSALHYFPVLFSVFIFILFSNLIGLMPFGFTVTGHIIVTGTLALAFNLAWIFLGFGLHGLGFLRLFVPSGISSKGLLAIIVVIELISYTIRTFSLSVRLFANMMAGHTLLHILSSFGVSFTKMKYFFIAFIPFILVLGILLLEFGIALLQAYVFVILLCIYLNDSLHPGH